jgi:hypothetical protein
MVRRFLCFGVILLLIWVSVPACQKQSTPTKGATVSDPDAGARPKPAGAKGG